MNKFLWMSRQLRHFNDAGPIINWANAMLIVKGLLVDPLPACPVLGNIQPTSQPTSPLPASHHQITTNNLQRWPERSITPPTIISFQPCRKKPLTKSPSWCTDYVPIPTKPSPLIICTHSHPSISPTNSLAPCPKRRKIAISPEVDYNASTTNLTNSKSSSHINNPMSTRGAKRFDGREEPAIFEVWDRTSPPSMDEVYKEEFARLSRDANKARISWDIYVSQHKSTYPRCAYYICKRKKG